MTATPQRHATERKVELVGKDRVRVEFTIDELVSLSIFDPGSVAACNGCNKCMAADIGPMIEGGVQRGG
jgi:hypothetical protein